MKINDFLIKTWLCVIFSIAYSAYAQQNNKITSVGYTYEVKTTLGDIKLFTYNETPQHKTNFEKLVSTQFYDSILFHRVIDQFMIQAGDPYSKYAKANTPLGDGDSNYMVAAEFNAKIIHKKGALAAARNGDDVNPTKGSSACQFYIVEGKVFTIEQLKKMEMTFAENKKRKLYTKWQKDSSNILTVNKLKMLEEAGDKLATDSIYNNYIAPQIEKEYLKNPFAFTPQQIETYTTTGGTPHLDGNYTVFGEVISGLEIIDLISQVKKDNKDRPVEDVRILSIRRVKNN